MYFPKQQYESIVPDKSGINRSSASHDIDLFYLIHSFKITSIIYNETFPLIIAPIYRPRIVIDVTTRRGT